MLWCIYDAGSLMPVMPFISMAGHFKNDSFSIKKIHSCLLSLCFSEQLREEEGLWGFSTQFLFRPFSHIQQFAVLAPGEAFCHRPKETRGSTGLYPLYGLHSRGLGPWSGGQWGGVGQRTSASNGKSSNPERRRQERGGKLTADLFSGGFKTIAGDICKLYGWEWKENVRSSGGRQVYVKNCSCVFTNKAVKF